MLLFAVLCSNLFNQARINGRFGFDPLVLSVYESEGANPIIEQAVRHLRAKRGILILARLGQASNQNVTHCPSFILVISMIAGCG